MGHAIEALVDQPSGPVLFAVDGVDGGAPQELEPHRHARGQLFASAEGLLTVVTRAGRWLMPPGRALWVPPREEHAAAAKGAARGWAVYVAPRACHGLARTPVVVAVTPLLREAIARSATWMPKGRALDAAERRVAAVILDELARAPREPLHLPMPEAPALARVAGELVADPADARGLEELARSAAMAKRTFTRHFRDQTGISFAQWRTQLRMHVAVERLAMGSTITRLALDLGYESPSAFTAAFRRVIGAPPSRFAR